jgi:hypothetical protein
MPHSRHWTDVSLFAAALFLAVVEVVHPHPHHDLLELDAQTWLIIHYLQVPLFPLSALALTRFVRPHGKLSVACRVAAFTFAIAFTAFDTAAGIVTGLLVKAAHASPDPESFRAAIMTVWNNPIVGGSREHPPLLAIVGTGAWLVGCVIAAVGSRRRHAPWPTTVLLVVSAFPLLVFRSHAWPGGPLAFGSLAAAGIYFRLWSLAQQSQPLTPALVVSP